MRVNDPVIICITGAVVILVIWFGSIALDYRPKLTLWQVTLEATPAKAIEEDKKSPLYRGEAIETSQVFTLKDVEVIKRMNSKGETVDSTVLFFEETETVRKMDDLFDPDGEITQRAKSLIGARVFTTAWQPEKYHPSRWWRQIYKAP